MTRCVGCEAEYEPSSARQLYCCRLCKELDATREKRELRALERADVECPCCHEVFRQRRVDQQWCSAECRVRANGRLRQGLPADYVPERGRWASTDQNDQTQHQDQA